MNKIIKLLFLSLVMGNLHSATNKTFLAGRPAGVNLAIEGTTWHTQMNKPHGNDDKWGGSLQVVGFYQENTNDNALGKYFGFSDQRTLVIGNAADTGVDIDKRHLLHDHAGIRNHIGTNGIAAPFTGDNPFSGTINLSMKYNVGGVRLDYQQDLDSAMKGLYFKVRAPILWEERKAILGLDGSISATIDANVTSGTYDGILSTTVNIGDYFSGSITQSAGALYSDQQATLNKAKIYGDHDKVCLGDIDILLGWSFWETEDHHAGLNVGATLPTSSKPNGDYLWGGQCGNRGHWGFGMGMDSKYAIWKYRKEKIELDITFDWRYLFQNSETRTLGLVDKNWGQYFLLGQINLKGVFPAANVLTNKVNVEPGNQLDLRAGLAYNNDGFIFDIGYNLYARERERVTLNSFPDGTYGLAGNDYNSGARIGVAITGIPDGHGKFKSEDIATYANVTIAATAARANDAATPFLTKSNIDVSSAETPSMVTHKVYGGFGHSWNEWETPLMIGIGGSFEFTSIRQNAIENWAFWAKLGLSF